MLLRTFAAIILTFASSFELSNAAPIATRSTEYANRVAMREVSRVFGRLASVGTLVGRDGDRRKTTTMVSGCEGGIGGILRICDQEEYSVVDCCIKNPTTQILSQITQNIRASSASPNEPPSFSSHTRRSVDDVSGGPLTPSMIGLIVTIIFMVSALAIYWFYSLTSTNSTTTDDVPPTQPKTETRIYNNQKFVIMPKLDRLETITEVETRDEVGERSVRTRVSRNELRQVASEGASSLGTTVHMEGMSREELISREGLGKGGMGEERISVDSEDSGNENGMRRAEKEATRK